MRLSNLTLGLLLAAVSGLPALGQNYTVTNLSLGGSWSTAFGMNASGQEHVAFALQWILATAA